MGLFEIAIITAMLVLNGLFAAYEIALASVNLGSLKLLADQKKRGARAAVAMKLKMEASLAVVQIGITLVGAIAAATGGAQAEEAIAPWLRDTLGLSERVSGLTAIAMVVLPLSAVTIVMGELVPKTAALRNREKVCLALSPLILALWYVFFPAVTLFEFLTKRIVSLFERNTEAAGQDQTSMGVRELRAYARALRTSRVIDDNQERIILGASDLTRIKVTDIVVPPEDIIMLDAGAPITDHFVTVHLEGYTRFPVTEIPGNPDAITGYVNLKDLIFLAKNHPDRPDLREIVRPIMHFPPDATIGTAFAEMMRDHAHMALVRGGGGTVRGMLTLEDILEEVVGDIEDEYDRLPRYLTASGKQTVVSGGVTLSQLFTQIGRTDLLEKYPGDIHFSEWARLLQGKKPRGGDVITTDGLRILVRKVRRSHVLEAIVSEA